MIAPTSPRDESVVEFTLRAAVAGIGFGILFGAANAYIGLRVGLTAVTSIPIAVLTVALFRLMRRRPGGMILEATGTIFTIPALFLWGIIPPSGGSWAGLPRRHPRDHGSGTATPAADRPEELGPSFPIRRVSPAPRCCGHGGRGGRRRHRLQSDAQRPLATRRFGGGCSCGRCQGAVGWTTSSCGGVGWKEDVQRDLDPPSLLHVR